MSTITPPDALHKIEEGELTLIDPRTRDFLTSFHQREGPTEGIRIFARELRNLPVVMQLILTIYAVAAWLLLAPQELPLAILRDDWEQTSGSIVSRGQDGDNYTVTYEYRAGTDETRYEETQVVSQATYQRAEKGAPITVEVIPDNPQFSRLADDTTATDRAMRAFTIGGGLVAVMLVVALLISLPFYLWHTQAAVVDGDSAVGMAIIMVVFLFFLAVALPFFLYIAWTEVRDARRIWRVEARAQRLVVGKIIGEREESLTVGPADPPEKKVLYYVFESPDSGQPVEGRFHLSRKLSYRADNRVNAPARDTPVLVIYLSDKRHSLL
jgi:uncharacterized membrane protein